MPPLSLARGCFGLILMCALWGSCPLAQAQIVPGTGNLLNYDDLEDVNWAYIHNFPKSSKEEDENIRYPLGASNNRMWSESPKRGAPDVVKRTETPIGGLPGSKGALYMRTRDTGIPGHPGNKQAQDDFVLAARPCGVGYSPNFVVRVYLPEFKDWEQRQGVSFGIRAGMQGLMEKEKPNNIGRRMFGGAKKKMVSEMEPYYPGFFIAFNPLAANPAYLEDHAQILIRSDGKGHEVAGPKITQTGWWTFGMSVTSDSRCHYYAHAGIADLTAADHLYSSLPYGIRGDHFNTIFFNVCSADNASSWSTPWIIDDPKVFYSGQPVFKPAQQQAQQPQPLKTAQAPSNVPNTQNASLSKETPANPATPVIPAPVQPGVPLPLPMSVPMPIPMTLPAAPAVAPPPPMAPPQAPPVLTPAAAAPIPTAPVAPLLPPLITPAPVSTAPALLSTGTASSLRPVALKPMLPLRIPASTSVEPDTTPAAPGPRLILPAISSANTQIAKTQTAVLPPAATVAKPQTAVRLSAATVAKPASVRLPQSNPFDDVQTPNAPSEVAKPAAESTPVQDGDSVAPPAPPEEEPPLVIPTESADSTEVGLAPVSPPPAQ